MIAGNWVGPRRRPKTGLRRPGCGSGSITATTVLILLAQVARRSPEAQLARSFEQELRDRGLRGDDTGLEGDR